MLDHFPLSCAASVSRCWLIIRQTASSANFIVSARRYTFDAPPLPIVRSLSSTRIASHLAKRDLSHRCGPVTREGTGSAPCVRRRRVLSRSVREWRGSRRSHCRNSWPSVIVHPEFLRLALRRACDGCTPSEEFQSLGRRWSHRQYGKRDIATGADVILGSAGAALCRARGQAPLRPAVRIARRAGQSRNGSGGLRDRRRRSPRRDVRGPSSAAWRS